MRARIARLAFPLLVVSAGLAACGGEPAMAAVVNGERVPASAVDRELADIGANAPFVESRRRQGLAFQGTQPGTYDAFAVAELLNRRVTAVLVRQELARRRLDPATADVASAREALRREVVDPESGASLLEGFPGRYVDEQVRIRAESDLLQAAEGGVGLDDAALRAAYEADPERYRVWCVRWIVFGIDPDAPTRAAAAKAAIAAGEDFAQVAVRQSVDAGSAGRGGALGCQTRDGLARLGTGFRDVAVGLTPGQVSDVGRDDVGTFLVQATDVKVRPIDEVRGNVRARVLAPTEERYDQLLRRLRREADVQVAARFGRWDRSDPEAIAIMPSGARPTTTAAVSPPTGGP